jgi:peptidyl-prolyl cis-trans isomerase SurA
MRTHLLLPPSSIRVVAVVNKHAILASDIDDEIRLSVLDPNLVGQGTLTRQGALEQLISRALIEQQIREQDMQAIAPSQDEVNARLEQIRSSSPPASVKTAPPTPGGRRFLPRTVSRRSASNPISATGLRF